MKPTNTETQQVERDIQGQGMASEQAADLARLQAAATDVDAAAPVEAEPQRQGPDLAAEISGVITVAVQTLAPMFPSLRGIYTEETTQAAAGAVAAVCNKHGWLQGGMFGEYGEEIACLAVCGPLAFATMQGVRADLEKHKAKATVRLEPGSQQPEAGPQVVSFGPVEPLGEGTA